MITLLKSKNLFGQSITFPLSAVHTMQDPAIVHRLLSLSEHFTVTFWGEADQPVSGESVIHANTSLTCCVHFTQDQKMGQHLCSRKVLFRFATRHYLGALDMVVFSLDWVNALIDFLQVQ